MISLCIYIVMTALLICEGRWLLRLFAPSALYRGEQWLLGYPVAAFLNALMIFDFTVLSIPLNIWTLVGGHGVFLAFLIVATQKCGRTPEPIDPPVKILDRGWVRIGVVLLAFLIGAKLIYGISHAVLLPSYYFDTISQWNMRAQISFFDQAIAFDLDESRGMSKPQYPILLHGLQILFMQLKGTWSDALANAATGTLTLTSLLGLGALIRRRIGGSGAVVTLYLLLSVPLLSMHLSQGHGDIHVLTYLLLSAVFLLLAREGVSSKLLLLSGIFVAASAWCKQEGLFFGIVPWIALIGSMSLLLKWPWKKWVYPIAVTAFLGLPWTILIVLKGFPIGAHSGDFLFGFRPEGVSHAVDALFFSGSFGLWIFLLPLLVGLLLFVSKNDIQKMPGALLVLSWSILTFIETLLVFLWTPNVAFLMNQQTFHRTMMIPLLLAILACAVGLWERRFSVVT